MRTTVTLDPDTEALVRKRMKERGVTFKAAVNELIRAGTASAQRPRVPLPTFRMGKPKIDLTKALQIAAALEDEEIIRKLDLGK